MRYTWEQQDIKVGRQVDSNKRVERYIIGWEPGRTKEEGNLVLVSLKDGMVATKNQTERSMADHLNKSSMRPVDVHEDDIESTDDIL